MKTEAISSKNIPIISWILFTVDRLNTWKEKIRNEIELSQILAHSLSARCLEPFSRLEMLWESHVSPFSIEEILFPGKFQFATAVDSVEMFMEACVTCQKPTWGRQQKANSPDLPFNRFSFIIFAA